MINPLVKRFLPLFMVVACVLTGHAQSLIAPADGRGAPPPRPEGARPVQTQPVRAPAMTPAPGWRVIEPYDERNRPNPEAFDWSGVALGISAGTLGGGVEGTIYLADWANLRVGGHYASLLYKKTTSGIDYDYDYTGLNGLFLLDLYPGTQRGFRFSVGAAVNSSDVSVDGVPRRTFTVGDSSFTPARMGAVSGKARFDTVSPYVGIGFDNPVRPDQLLQLSLDIGVLYQDYTLSLDVDQADFPAAGIEKLKSDVRNTVDWLKWYPVITLSVAYHF